MHAHARAPGSALAAVQQPNTKCVRESTDVYTHTHAHACAPGSALAAVQKPNTKCVRESTDAYTHTRTHTRAHLALH